MAFKLPDLPYAYNALEPHVDARTMEIHHSKHHKAYTDNLNKAIEGKPEDQMAIEDIIKNINNYPVAIRNNGGGYWNHCMFWEIMSPNGGGIPSGDLAAAIDASFGTFDKMKEEFNAAATTRFGSGWAWLCKMADGSLKICSTANQDNPLMPIEGHCGGTPILCLDVWEHAYYLNYQNRRPDYIAAWWNVVNWEEVTRRFKS